MKKIGIKDVLIVLGTLSVFWGIWQIYPPASFITLGLWLIYIGVK